MRKTLIALGLLLPAAVLALDYSDATDRYRDASSFTMAERAAINVLTNLGVLEGNPDGTYRPDRTLNRAEFLKIALLSRGDIVVSSSDAEDCFSDVARDAWFSRYVCLGKRRGMVQGYPDGLFHPERPINDAEAVKILMELYGHNAYTPSAGPWYAPYRDEAAARGLLTENEPEPGAFISRGHMARLAAAFRAEWDDELAMYRAAERGETAASASSASSASSVSTSSASSVSSVSSASSASSSSLALLPAISRILLVDRVTPPVADGTFLRDDQDTVVREVRITLKKRIRSFSEMYLQSATGMTLATMRLDSTDTDERKWYASIDASVAPKVPKNAAKTFAIAGKLRPWGLGGVSGELIELERFSLIVQSADGTSSWEILPTDKHFPAVQTAQTLLDQIANAGETAGALQAGTNRTVGSFRFAGTMLPGTQVLDVEQLTFQISAAGASISNARIAGDGTSDTAPCPIIGTTMTCTSVPASLRDASAGRTLRIIADVTRDASEGAHTLQLKLVEPGTVGVNGAIAWFDGTTHFTWVDLLGPLAQGTAWTVTP